MRLFTLLAIVIFTLLHSVACCQKTDAMIDQQAAAILPKVVEWRRYLHEHPELSNREYETSKFVADYLRSLGLEVQTGIAKTGVVALLKGGRPGPVVALRADMDALPVEERTNVPFASKVKGEYMGSEVPVMHACGHDSHMAILLGTAQVLASMKKDVPGTVKFIFQPAEEGAPGNEEGGAALMIKEGVMKDPKVDAIFGLHINSQTPTGIIKYKSGAEMAAADILIIKVKGKGSHGSQPWSGIDPVMVSAQIIEGLQTIVSRQSNLTTAPVVITIGKINGGVRNNIISEEVIMEGTIRTLDSAMQVDVHDKIRRTVTNIAEASGATAEVTIITKTRVTYNNLRLTEMMAPSLEKAAGKENVQLADWTTGAEDFSYYGSQAPAFFFFLGGMPAGQDPSTAAPHHTPDFFIDDSRLDVGVKAFCHLVFDYAALSKQ
ncbi:MAG: amidohydrolase [Chitinophagales bacterium]|nr:amidohydrolase [Chitinophagales bacterium]